MEKSIPIYTKTTHSTSAANKMNVVTDDERSKDGRPGQISGNKCC
jgi:hypothetical protein